MNKSKVLSMEDPVDKDSLCYKIFNAFVTDSQIYATESELRQFIFDDLQICQEKVPEGFMEHAPGILIAFINNWSGWDFKGQYREGQIQETHYYQRFRKYLLHKIGFIAAGLYTKVMKTLPTQKTGIDNSFTTYMISITCPAVMLNTIAFSNVGDDVIMKQHIGSKWLQLSIPQLVNWPHIEVTFESDDLHFVRRQATEFNRYLNFLPHDAHKHTNVVVEEVQCTGNPECYSYTFLENYIQVYLESLSNILQITQDKLNEIQTILIQFLEDIKHININDSIATSSSVLFRLTSTPFIRNKKLVKNANSLEAAARVGYCEIITPKILLMFLNCNAIQKNSPNISFEYTDKLKDSVNRWTTNVQTVVPKITYRCTFCNTKAEGIDAKQQILLHMRYNHKMEQHVRCTLCKKQYEVQTLASCRWKHKCIPEKKNDISEEINLIS